MTCPLLILLRTGWYKNCGHFWLLISV